MTVAARNAFLKMILGGSMLLTHVWDEMLVTDLAILVNYIRFNWTVMLMLVSEFWSYCHLLNLGARRLCQTIVNFGDRIRHQHRCNLHFTIVSDVKVQKIILTSKFCLQHSVVNIKMSSTSLYQNISMESLWNPLDTPFKGGMRVVVLMQKYQFKMDLSLYDLVKWIGNNDTSWFHFKIWFYTSDK